MSPNCENRNLSFVPTHLFALTPAHMVRAQSTANHGAKHARARTRRGAQQLQQLSKHSRRAAAGHVFSRMIVLASFACAKLCGMPRRSTLGQASRHPAHNENFFHMVRVKSTASKHARTRTRRGRCVHSSWSARACAAVMAFRSPLCVQDARRVIYLWPRNFPFGVRVFPKRVFPSRVFPGSKMSTEKIRRVTALLLCGTVKETYKIFSSTFTVECTQCSRVGGFPFGRKRSKRREK